MASIGNSPTQQAFTPAIDYFSGNGSTTAFTLSRPVASVAQVQVTIDNVAQNPSSAYTVSSNTITFTSAPLSGTNNIYVYYTSPITQVIAPGQGTVTSDSFGTITNFTTTGNTVLGDATTDTLTVGVTGIVKDASGNVGIGTASPTTYGATTKLAVVSSSTAGSWLVGGSNAGAYAYFSNNAQSATTNVFQIGQGWSTGSDNLCFLNSNGANPLMFATNGSERMRIGSNGQIYMATTSAVAPGGPSGQVNILNPNNDGNWALALQNNATTSSLGRGIGIKNNVDFNNSSSEFIYCTGAGNGRFYVPSNGGLYNYSANNVNLSDQREKKDIELAPNYLEKICQIPVKTFLFNDQTDTDLNLGAIAQDVQAICPELVTESNWGTAEEPKIRFSIYQTDLQYALMKSIQELKVINDTQAETINALTARIEALENR